MAAHSIASDEEELETTFFSYSKHIAPEDLVEIDTKIREKGYMDDFGDVSAYTNIPGSK